jgi:PAS domain S-box-containing protein
VSGAESSPEPSDLSAALRESEERLRLIQAAAHIGSFDWDMRTGQIFRSPEYLELHGLPPDSPLTGIFSDHWLERVHPEDRDQVQAWAREDMARPCEFAREYRIVRPDTGEVRWLYNRGQVVGDADGRPVRMVSAQTDITDRKLGELRSRYMAGLSDALRQASDARDAMRAACEHLGRFLEVGQTGFGEVDETESWVEIWADWSAGRMPSRAGRYRLADFGPAIVDWFRSGQPIVTEDIELLASLPRLEEAAERFGARSGIDLPLVRDGKLIAILGIHHDRPRRWSEHDLTIARITAQRTADAVDRARAEAALRQSEERMRLAIAGTGLGSYDLDMTTGEGVWSETAFAMLGLPPNSSGRASVEMWAQCLHPEDREAVTAAHNDAAQRGGPWQLEHRVIDQGTRKVRWLNTFGQFIGPADRRRSIGVVIDITERKEAELRQAFLLRVSDRLRGAQDVQAATSDVAEMLARELDVDTAGFVQINAERMEATVLSGYTTRQRPDSMTLEIGPERGPLRGASVRDLAHGRTFRLADAASDPRTRDHADHIKARTGASAAIHVPMMRSGVIGAVLFLHSAEPRDWSDAEVQLVEEVAARTWEAIERIRAENALRETNRTLAQDIAVAVAERETALAQLHQAQKLETIGQLTGGIAHDFNNLLTPITGALDLLRHRFAGEDARTAKLIEGALQSADRARVLVQRLLSFARRQPLQPEPVDVAALIAGMSDLIASSIGRGVGLLVEAAADLPAASADPNQLELAILNLCVNARDAMPDGGTLTIRIGSARDPEGLAPGDYVRMSVEDTGIGMDAETMRLAIEPFFSTKPKERGTGLGLSMVHGLAGQLGGALFIDSAPGRGTRIDLWLPAATVAPRPKVKHQSAPPQLARPLNLLLVDDEELVRSGTAEMLRDLGHQVDEAASGRAALERLAAGRYDALITDFMMPGMDGIQLAREVKAMAPSLPVLLITGFLGSADQAGNMPRLAKPFSRDELGSALAALVHENA